MYLAVLHMANFEKWHSENYPRDKFPTYGEYAIHRSISMVAWGAALEAAHNLEVPIDGR